MFQNLNVIFLPGNNVCFYGDCKYYCDTGHPVCGRPHVLDGSLCAWLPDVPRYRVKSPWRRSYSKVFIDVTITWAAGNIPNSSDGQEISP